MTETLLDKPISKHAVTAVMAKISEIGGVGQDKDFEAAFSNLAHAYMREKAPSLEPYEVGFELLERSDDGKRAVGITGFQVGDQLFYCPVFWLAGKIKGHELLFLKDQSLFVPLKENWINYMLERKLPEIGQSVSRDPVRLGIRRPDILRQTRSGLKYAAADLFAGLGAPSPMAMPPEQSPMSPMGAPPHEPTMQMAQSPVPGMPPEGAGAPPTMPPASPLPQPPSPQLGAPPFGALHQAPPMSPQQHSDPMGGIGTDVDSVDTFDSQGGANGMPEPANMAGAQQNPMAAPQGPMGAPQDPMGAPKMAALHAMAVLPDMDIISLPGFIRYVGKRAFHEFHNILQAAPGIAKKAFELHGEKLLNALKEAEHYDPKLLTKADCDRFHAELKRALAEDGPDLAIEDEDNVVDKRDESKSSRVYADSINVQLFNPGTTGVYDVVLRHGKIQKCFVSLNSRREYGGRRAAVILTMKESGPQVYRTVYTLDQVWATKSYGLEEWTAFAASLPKAKSLDTVGGSSVVLVTRNGEAAGPYRIGKITSDKDGQTAFMSDGGNELVVDSGESRYFRQLQERIYVPADATVVRCDEYAENLSLGEPAEVDREAFAGFAKLSVAKHGNHMTIASNLDRRTVPVGKQAMQVLMRGHGLGAGQARTLLQKAASQLNPVVVRIKYADNAYLATNQRIGPMDDLPNDYGSYDMKSGDSVPEHEWQYVNSPVDIPPEVKKPADQVHYVSPPDETAFQVAQQAGQQGQQQAFDSGVLTSMLRNMRDDQLIDRFIPALSRAMDASGRLLYQFYWHQEDFAERYGDKDMPELGDSLRNIFEGLGDIVLKLKQKTVDPYPEEQDLGVSLTDLAGAS